MIYSISCDKSTFKRIDFKPNFNVIVAERKSTSEKDTSNALGKSTLIEIIQFCLGGNPDGTLLKTEVSNWTFTLDLDIAKKRYAISRNTKNPDIMFVDGDCSTWLKQPFFDKEYKKKIISIKDFNKSLGILVFGLEENFDNEYKYHPMFRDLISYFVRRSTAGGFLNPFQTFAKQPKHQIQINNAFLLNLGWEFASKLQLIKDKEETLSQFKKIAEKTGVVANIVGNMGELEASRIKLEEQLRTQKIELDNFKVHPQYGVLQKESNLITKLIHELVNKNIDDKQLYDYYKSSLNIEKDAKPEKVIELYKEAGLVLPKSLTKKIEEVFKFHDTVVINRKDFLNSELELLEGLIEYRNKQIEDYTNKRAEILSTLKTHGALDEYMSLQFNYQSKVSELKDIVKNIDNINKLEEGRSAVNIERETLIQQAKIEFKERDKQRSKAILAFDNYSKELYSASGVLNIGVDKDGFRFGVEIKGSGSSGKGNMVILCYDLVLATLWAKKSNGIFLAHDSIIFADVDNRQIAQALLLAEKESREQGFQYICTMNSDKIPTNDLNILNKGFNIENYIVQKFTDESDQSGLLGIKF